MPESNLSSLAVMHKRWLTNCYGEEVSQLLSGEQIPRLPEHAWLHPSYYRYLSIATQGGWFHDKVRELQNLSGIGGLAYLNEKSCTHEHKVVTKDNSGNVVWEETHGYTVLTYGWDEEITAIRSLEDWCHMNTTEAGKVLETSADSVTPAIESQFFTLDPGAEGLGEGNGPEFFFSTLHTIGELMRFARFHKKTPNMWVVYRTTLRYGP